VHVRHRSRARLPFQNDTSSLSLPHWQKRSSATQENSPGGEEKANVMVISAMARCNLYKYFDSMHWAEQFLNRGSMRF